jgi:Domain of unknown function (DUF1996)
MSVLKLHRRTVLLLTSVALVVLLTLAFLLASSRNAAQAADNASVISVRCEGTHTAPDDPIVYPGKPGLAHMHEFIGNPTTDAFSTYSEMVDASPVKCETQADTAGYWAPALYKNGVRIPIHHSFNYYRGPPGVKTIPANLKIVAGGDTRNPPVPLEQARGLSWSCLDSGPFYEQPPNCSSVGKPIKAHIQFPNCWDGFRLDSSDHMSHMAYWGRDKKCPQSHPVRLPRLRQNVAYNIRDGRGATLSSDHGFPNGTQLHADFWNTWDQAVLNDAIETCINGNLNCKRLKDNDPRLQ